MTRVVLDTNVLLSAILFGGKPEQVLKLVRLEKINAITSPAILLELTNVLTTKFSWTNKEAKETIAFLSKFVDSVSPKKKVDVLSDDADNRVLECAVSGGADVIVSGDHHLLELIEYNGIEIITPAEFLGDWLEF